MTRVSPHALLRAVAANRLSCPIAAHQREAIAAQAFGWTLSEGERWFLDSVQRLSAISERQQTRLREIASKVERNRG